MTWLTGETTSYPVRSIIKYFLIKEFDNERQETIETVTPA